jgi:DnaK suppressor protein
MASKPKISKKVPPKKSVSGASGAKKSAAAKKPAAKKPAAKKPAAKKPAAKKPAAKKPAAKKPAAKKPAAKKPAAKKPAAKKPAAKKPAAKKPAAKKPAAKKPAAKKPAAKKPAGGLKPGPFLNSQRQRLLALKDTLLDSMNGVARDSLRSRADGSEASAFGMHQADAGSDAYDRDFALSLLSQEQDSLYEIDEALKRIESGSYGVCEMSGKPIPRIRLEALPFTRYTVEAQAELEKHNRFNRVRQPTASLFGLGDEDGDDDSDDTSDSKD